MIKEKQIELLRKDSTIDEIEKCFNKYSEHQLLDRYRRLSVLCQRRIKSIQRKFLPGGGLNIIDLWILKEKRLVVLIFQKYYHKNI